METQINDSETEASRLEAILKRYEKCFERIAIAYGIASPWVLVGMAQNDEENYAEILARFVEQQQDKANAK